MQRAKAQGKHTGRPALPSAKRRQIEDFIAPTRSARCAPTVALGLGGLGVCCCILRAGIHISIGWRSASRRRSFARRLFAQNRPISATQ